MQFDFSKCQNLGGIFNIIKTKEKIDKGREKKSESHKRKQKNKIRKQTNKQIIITFQGQKEKQDDGIDSDWMVQGWTPFEEM